MIDFHKELKSLREIQRRLNLRINALEELALKEESGGVDALDLSIQLAVEKSQIRRMKNHKKKAKP